MSKTYDEHLDEQEERGRHFRQDEPISKYQHFFNDWVSDPDNGIDVNIIEEDVVQMLEDFELTFK